MVTNGFAVHNPGADPTHFFRTDKMGQNVALLDGEVVLTKNAPITYVERSWDEENNEVRSETKTRVLYTVLEGSHDNNWIGLGGNEWYAVKGKARYKVLNIIGNAHLVLSDGATLNCAHIKDTNDCVCGQKYDGSNDNWTVNIITTADGTSYAAAEVNKVVRGKSYVLPVPGAVNGLTFMGYLKTTTAPSGIEMMDNEILELVDAGETITPEADVDYYARYRYNYKTMWTWADDGSKATVSISCDVNNDTQDDIEAYYCQETDRTEATEEANGEVTYSASAEYKKAEGLTYQFTDQHTRPLFYTLNIDLNYTGDNTETLEKYQNRKANVTLRGRTFYKDNSWNTLCLPFDIDDFEGTPLADATVKTLSSSDYDSSAGKLTLNFVDASAISAGKPCIVRWSSGEDVINPTFNEVIVSGTEGIVGTPFVDFKGTVSPVALTAGDRTVFYMGSNNKLYHPNANVTINANLAYFSLNGISFSDQQTSSNALEFVMNLGEGDITGIVSFNADDKMVAPEGWYDLQGRRLSGRPTKRGLYIYQG